ncbi:MAG: transcriptional regulator [Isosphaeraceae bacterium]
MNMLPSDLARVLGWLILDTFRQARSSRVLWFMAGLSAIAILTCASIRIEGASTLRRPGEITDFVPRNDADAQAPTRIRDGVDLPTGYISFAFGTFRVPLTRDAQDAVHFVERILAGGVADTAGLLLAIIWTAGFLPAFLAPGSATLMLARPVPRAWLLVGKFAGVLVFVAAQATFLVVGTWAALGLKTGLWDPAYLLCIPLLCAQFAAFFSMSTLIASHLKGAVACALGTLLFWALCWGMNYGRHALVALPVMAPDAAEAAPPLKALAEFGYWILPKPGDLGMILSDLIGDGPQFAPIAEFDVARGLGRFHPAASVASSIIATAALLGLAARKFRSAEY